MSDQHAFKQPTAWETLWFGAQLWAVYLTRKAGGRAQFVAVRMVFCSKHDRISILKGGALYTRIRLRER